MLNALGHRFNSLEEDYLLVSHPSSTGDAIATKDTIGLAKRQLEPGLVCGMYFMTLTPIVIQVVQCISSYQRSDFSFLQRLFKWHMMRTVWDVVTRV